MSQIVTALDTVLTAAKAKMPPIIRQRNLIVLNGAVLFDACVWAAPQLCSARATLLAESLSFLAKWRGSAVRNAGNRIHY